jgi:hypothetical protein
LAASGAFVALVSAPAKKVIGWSSDEIVPAVNEWQVDSIALALGGLVGKAGALR